MAGVPGPLSFLGVLGASGRLYARKPLPLIGAFALVYAFAVGLIALATSLDVDGSMGIVVLIVLRTLIAIAATFATAYSAILLSDVIAGRDTPRGSVAAILRVHAKEFISAGLFAVVISFPLEFLLPGISFAIVGPPVVAQVVALEYRAFGEAASRTRELLRYQSARVLLYLFGLAFIVLVVLYSFGAYGLGLYGLPLVMPFYAAATLALYLDLRARGEELDLEGFVAERELAMDEKPVAGSTPG